MKTIKKEIEISAPKEKVWAVLLDDMYTKDWMSIFKEGTTAESDWIEGHRIAFSDKGNNGIFGKIARKKPYEKLIFVYEGMLVNGVEDTESPMAKQFIGAEESYRLSDKNGNTLLSITSDMTDEMYDEMARLWESALQRISELARTV